MRISAVSPRLDAFQAQFAAFLHGLYGVDHHVEQRLLEHVPVHADVHAFGARLHVMRILAASACGRVSSSISRTTSRSGMSPIVQLHRPREIEESFHHAVQAQNLARDHFHLRRDIGLALLQACARHFHVQQDGVERIFHLVRHAAGNAADGRQPVGGLQLASDLALRFGIA